MRKEVLIAVLVGIMLGLFVTYGIYTANKAIIDERLDNPTPQTTTIPTPSTSPTPEMILTIIRPENNLVFQSPEVNIEGNANPNSVIAITTEDDELFTESDNQGKFSLRINLIKGANTIRVQATDSQKLSAMKTINLIYSTALESKEETKQQDE